MYIIHKSLSLQDHGLKDGDVVILQHHRQNTGQGPSQAQGGQALRGGNPGPQTGGGFPQLDFSGIQVPGRGNTSTPRSRPPPPPLVDQDDPAFIRDQLLASPEQLALLRQNNPPLSEALHSGDFGKYVMYIRRGKHEF